MEHTPGPWAWKPAKAWNDTELWDFDTLEGARYGDVLMGVWHNDSSAGIGVNNLANAKLIAAAPELLAASVASLELVLALLRHSVAPSYVAHLTELRVSLESTIAKATP